MQRYNYYNILFKNILDLDDLVDLDHAVEFEQKSIIHMNCYCTYCTPTRQHI